MAPPKSRSKQRLYRKRDIEFVWLLKKLLWDQRYTIAGARQRIQELGLDEALERSADAESLDEALSISLLDGAGADSLAGEDRRLTSEPLGSGAAAAPRNGRATRIGLECGSPSSACRASCSPCGVYCSRDCERPCRIAERTQAAVRRAFSETVDPDCHVPRPATEALLESLLHWCRSDGPGSTVAALVAPPDIGKTHLLRVIEARLAQTEKAPAHFDRDRRQSACRALYLPYAALSLPDLCHWVHGLLGLHAAGEVAAPSTRTATRSRPSRAGGRRRPALPPPDRRRGFDAERDAPRPRPGPRQAGAFAAATRCSPCPTTPARPACWRRSIPLRPSSCLPRCPRRVARRRPICALGSHSAGLGTELLDGLDPRDGGPHSRALGGHPAPDPSRRRWRCSSPSEPPWRARWRCRPGPMRWLGQPMDDPF